MNIDDWVKIYIYIKIYIYLTFLIFNGCAIFCRFHIFSLIAYFQFFGSVDIYSSWSLGQIMRLRDKLSGKEFCIANTHLLFNIKRSDIRIAQLIILLAHLDKVCRVWFLNSKQNFFNIRYIQVFKINLFIGMWLFCFQTVSSYYMWRFQSICWQSCL